VSSDDKLDENVQRRAENEDEAPPADAEQQAEESMSARVHHWTAVSRRVRQR
jgi:hypothetical protein